MAQARRKSSRYETYGNVAYETVGSGAVITIPKEGAVEEPMPRLRPKERTRAKARVRVQTRQPGVVSPFAVTGFLCIGVMVLLMLVCCVRLAVYTDEAVQLSSELSDLEEEEAQLLVQYGLAYDLQAIKEEMLANGTLVEPTESQKVVLDLSEPDNMVVYDTQEEGLLDKLGDFISGLFG
ncbi:MAG: hypothetical protein LIO42_05830 [Oscillospiraceae bacterium]|nr:hypothetical protein [Oscillospiraceae bacterium]